MVCGESKYCLLPDEPHDCNCYVVSAGGIRRMNIPPNLAFVEGVGDDKPGPMPDGKFLLMH